MEQQNEEYTYEINIYDLWKVIVKRRRIIIGIFLIFVISTAILSTFMPKIYRGEATLNVIDNSFLTTFDNVRRHLLIANDSYDARKIIDAMGRIDNEKKKLIFPKTYMSVNSAKLRVLKETEKPEKIAVTIEAKNTNDIPVSVSELVDFLNNMESVKTSFNDEREVLRKRSIELSNLQKTGQDSLVRYNKLLRDGKIDIGYNPLSLQIDIVNIENEKLAVDQALSKFKDGRIQLITPPSVSNKPVSPKILHNVFVAGILSLLVGIALAFLIEYIHKIKKREIVNSNS